MTLSRASTLGITLFMEVRGTISSSPEKTQMGQYSFIIQFLSPAIYWISGACRPWPHVAGGMLVVHSGTLVVDRSYKIIHHLADVNEKIQREKLRKLSKLIRYSFRQVEQRRKGRGFLIKEVYNGRKELVSFFRKVVTRGQDPGCP